MNLTRELKFEGNNLYNGNSDQRSDAESIYVSKAVNFLLFGICIYGDCNFLSRERIPGERKVTF